MISHLKRLRRTLIGWYHNHFEKIQKPRNLKPKSLGQTEKGQDIECYEIGNGHISCLLVGGIHGNEVGTVKLIYEMINYLIENENQFSNLKLNLIPCINRDGYAKALQNPDYQNDGKIGRTNSNGVDINRNFPTKDWQAESVYRFGKNYQEKRIINGGQKAGSEKEMQCLCNLIKETNIQFYWDFHSCGRDCMGGNDPKSQTLARLFCEKTGYRFYRLEEQSKLGFSGHPKEYCDEQNILFLQNEATYRWGSDWKNQKPGIIAVLETLNNE